MDNPRTAYVALPYEQLELFLASCPLQIPCFLIHGKTDRAEVRNGPSACCVRELISINRLRHDHHRHCWAAVIRRKSSDRSLSHLPNVIAQNVTVGSI
jgi:hypothetical protein